MDDLEDIRQKKQDRKLMNIILTCFDAGMVHQDIGGISRLWTATAALAAIKDVLGEDADEGWLRYYKKMEESLLQEGFHIP